ncbi:MAG: H4MPT-linked C1 transfer pathway protein, partial [Euryarchaeota archaeon]|nr:H4MPT-linked C1 transfer pathway protein [Euryarchaeota archaeon]
GIDIGGANTKVASTSGKTDSYYLPLWKENSLTDLLRLIKEEFDPTNVGVVMTAELADAFKTKRDGVHCVASCVRSVFAQPYFFSIEGKFLQTIDDTRWNMFAASNWAASAAFLGDKIHDCIFADVGSTTCDVIPIKGGKSLASATDFQRLCRDELIYMGVLRTNLAALLSTISLKGRRYRLSSELYAITADVHRFLGNISEAQYTCDTPDGGPRDTEACMQRIARMLLCDVDELGKENIFHIARAVERTQVSMLASALAKHAIEHGLNLVVGAGLGEFIIAQAAAARGLECCPLSHLFSKHVAEVFPAYATAQLLQQALKTEAV